MGNDKNVVSFPLSRATIPKGNAISAEILGVDDGSYFHVFFKDDETQRLYNEMSRKMRIAVNTGSCSRLPIGQKMKPGMDCLVEYTNRCGGTYVRARILQPIPETRKVRCELVDDLPEVYPHASEVFYTNFEILSYPKFSLKCTLMGFAHFQNSSHVKSLYEKYMKETWRPESTHCTVDVLERDSPIPTVQLRTSSGKTLTSLLQSLIPNHFTGTPYYAHSLYNTARNPRGEPPVLEGLSQSQGRDPLFQTLASNKELQVYPVNESDKNINWNYRNAILPNANTSIPLVDPSVFGSKQYASSVMSAMPSTNFPKSNENYQSDDNYD